MAEVKLLKKLSNYTDSEGKEKTATNFYVSCGGVLVPVEVKYFKDSETGTDGRYRERKVLLSAFAELLPDKPKSGDNSSSGVSVKGNKPQLQAFDDDGDTPF